MGPCPIIYADHMASGRAVRWIENAVLERVLPTYADTHTEPSHTGHQTTRFREEARCLVRSGIGAGEEVQVIFCGSEATGAMHVLLELLDMRAPAGGPDESPVVLLGPAEHHSNDLPWRESGAEIVRIQSDPTSRLMCSAGPRVKNSTQQPKARRSFVRSALGPFRTRLITLKAALGSAVEFVGFHGATLRGGRARVR